MVEQVDDNSCYNCNSGQFAMFEPTQIFFDVTAVVPSHCTNALLVAQAENPEAATSARHR
jgi:hypothetical protein